MSSIGLNREEQLALKDYALLSLKPRVMLVNLDDDAHLEAEGLCRVPDLIEHAPPERLVMPIRGRLEAEVAQLPEEEREVFLADFGIEEVISKRLLRISYAYLGLISFFTANQKEARAWTLHRGGTAFEAAGKVHTDMQRGFIRAEVLSFEDYDAHGTLKAAREAKAFRLEGKGYEVRDGDLIEFRHGG